MNRNFLARTQNQNGFSLVELMVAAGIASVVALGSAAILLQTADAQRRAQNDASVVATTQLFSKWLQPVRATNGGAAPRACSATLLFDTTINPAFNPAGQTDIVIKPSDVATDHYQKGDTVGNGTGLKIERIYLDDIVLATDLGTKKLYLANVYLITSQKNIQGTLMPSRPRNVAAVALTVLNADQSMESCNVEPILNNQQLCSALAGMVWNTNTSKCDQKVDTAPAPATNQLMCMPGFSTRGGTACKPISTNCKGGQLASKFDFAQVMNCSSPPTPVVAPQLTSPPVVLENAPIPPAPTVAAPVVFVPPAVPATATAPPAAPTTAASCTDGTAIGQATYNPCIGGTTYSTISMNIINCQPQLTTPPQPATACTAVAQTAYVSPPLTPAIQPSPIPPPLATTCTCNSRKINDLEYCMYCIKDANLGYGNVDYAYGVSWCQAGNLKPVAAPVMDTSGAPTCNNNYARARIINGKFSQYSENY